MTFQEVKLIIIRLYNEYIKKHLKRILTALVLSIIVAGSTSGIAWLLDPAVKKIFIEQDKTYAWLIPILIIIAFASKGLSLYFAKLIYIYIYIYIYSHIFLNIYTPNTLILSYNIII